MNLLQKFRGKKASWQKINLYYFFLDISNCATILYVPWLLRETPFDFFLNENHALPIITCNKFSSVKSDLTDVLEDAEFDVKVDGHSLCQSKDFIAGFEVYLASFYVFNITYPKSLENTMIFIQKFLLGILDDGFKAPGRVLTLISKAKKC